MVIMVAKALQWLQINDYNGIAMVTNGYNGIAMVTNGYNGIAMVTNGYNGSQGIQWLQ